MSNLQEQSTIMYESTFVCPFSTFWARLPGRVVAYLPYFPSYSQHCCIAVLYFPFYSLSPLFSIFTLYSVQSRSSIFHITLSRPYFPSHSLNCSISVLYFPSYSHNMCHPALQSYSTLLSPNFHIILYDTPYYSLYSPT